MPESLLGSRTAHLHQTRPDLRVTPTASAVLELIRAFDWVLAHAVGLSLWVVVLEWLVPTVTSCHLFLLELVVAFCSPVVTIWPCDELLLAIFCGEPRSTPALLWVETPNNAARDAAEDEREDGADDDEHEPHGKVIVRRFGHGVCMCKKKSLYTRPVLLSIIE